MLGTIILITITLIGIRQFLYYYVRRNWGKINPKNEESMDRKIVIITGANTGIGKATVEELANRDATVILACRNLQAAQSAIDDIRARTWFGELVPMELNLASLTSVRKFAAEFNNRYKKLHILINNAGVLTPLENKAKSQDGYELHFATNHLGHFLLTNLLLDKLKASAPSRILTLSSHIHSKGEIDFDDLMSERKNYRDSLTNVEFPLYANSKLANALFNKELGRRLMGTGVNTYALCPGDVQTDISRSLLPTIPWLVRWLFVPLGFLFKTPAEGAQTTLYCALSKDEAVKGKTGEMYRNCAYWDPRDRIELRDEDARRLWDESERLVGLPLPN